MKTLNVHTVAALLAAVPAVTSRPVRVAAGTRGSASTAAAIERQIDEIQHTFGVRWEW